MNPSLGAIGDERAVEPLIAVLDTGIASIFDGSKYLHKAAAEALGAIATPEAKETLVVRVNGQKGSTDKKRS